MNSRYTITFLTFSFQAMQLLEMPIVFYKKVYIVLHIDGSYSSPLQ